MNEEEIQEALKVIKEPITVNSIEYKYFDQENYEKLLHIYENCLWFVNIAEQFMQDFKNLQEENEFLKDYKIAYENVMIANKTLEKENQKLVRVIEEAIKYNKELCELYDCGMELSNAQTNLFILDKYKLTELKGGSDD